MPAVRPIDRNFSEGYLISRVQISCAALQHASCVPAQHPQVGSERSSSGRSPSLTCRAAGTSSPTAARRNASSFPAYLIRSRRSSASQGSVGDRWRRMWDLLYFRSDNLAWGACTGIRRFDRLRARDVSSLGLVRRMSSFFSSSRLPRPRCLLRVLAPKSAKMARGQGLTLWV